MDVRAGRGSPAAQADRATVGVGKHTHPHPGGNLARGVALGRTSREQRCEGRIEIFDVGKGHRSACHLPPGFRPTSKPLMLYPT